MGRIQHKGIFGNKNKFNKTKPVQKTRKQLRKEKRQEKKVNRAIHYQKKLRNEPEKTLRKSVTNLGKIDNDKSSKEEEQKDIEAVLTKAQKRQRSKDTRKERAERNAKKQKTEQLKQANLEEDKMIKQLEKRLKLNKRKSKSTPKSFVLDGLDCILYEAIIFNCFIYFVQKIIFL